MLPIEGLWVRNTEYVRISTAFNQSVTFDEPLKMQ
jgi:hypothetical protein